MKFKYSKKLLTMTLSSITIIGGVVPAYAIDTPTSPAISVVSSFNSETLVTVEETNEVFFDTDTIVATFAQVVDNKEGLVIVPVYGDPANNTDIIGNIGVGAVAIISQEVNGLSEIFFDDSVGYIESKYLQLADQEERNILNETNQVVEALVEISIEEYVEEPLEAIVVEEVAPVIEEVVMPVVEEVVEEAVVTSEYKYAITKTSSSLNLRTEATTSSSILSKLSNGTVADILEIHGDWIKVSVNGTVGFVSAEFVTLSNEKPEAPVEIPASDKAQEIINFAKQYLGTPYIYGGTNLNVGVDCSGFTYSVLKNFGINVNRTSRDQYSNGTAVSRENLQAGDLLFFNTGGNTRISHVGMYIGNGQYIHSTDSKGMGVSIANLSSAYAKNTYYGARRVIN